MLLRRGGEQEAARLERATRWVQPLSIVGLATTSPTTNQRWAWGVEAENRTRASREILVFSRPHDLIKLSPTYHAHEMLFVRSLPPPPCNHRWKRTND